LADKKIKEKKESQATKLRKAKERKIKRRMGLIM
jgi:hypothetical protein